MIVCTQFKCQTVLFDLPLWVRGDLGAIGIKRYSTFPKSPRLEPYHQIV